MAKNAENKYFTPQEMPVGYTVSKRLPSVHERVDEMLRRGVDHLDPAAYEEFMRQKRERIEQENFNKYL